MKYFPTIDLEKKITVCGVPARMTNLVAKDNSELWFEQRIVTESRKIESGEDEGYFIKAELRFDDECGNGHNSFSITGEINASRSFEERTHVSSGCIHEQIAAHFPELAHLIKWHLTSTDSPMHYVANTVYHASDRDHYGKRKGDPVRFETRFRFNGFPISLKPNGVLTEFLKGKQDTVINDFELVICPMPHKDKGKKDKYQFDDKYSFAGCEDKGWAYAPFDSLIEAEEWREAIKGGYSFEQVAVAFSEGKERDLDAARRSGVWPDATDDQLCMEPEELKAALMERLPTLIDAMKKDITEAGLYWSAADVSK